MIYFDKLKFDSELKYEVYLLNKYLTKHYDADTSIKLMKANNTKIDMLARALGEIDFEFFCLYFMSDTYVVKDSNTSRPLATAHYELFQLGTDIFVNDKYSKVCAIEPRGLAKTTVFDKGISVWLHCYKKSIFTLIGAKTDNDAGQFLDSIKNEFNNNQKIIKTFGKMVNPKLTKSNGERYKINAGEIEFVNGTYIRAVGSGTSVRGANWNGVRPSVFIGDDFQDEKNILTDQAREKQYNKWTKEIEEVGDKAVFRNGKKIKMETKIIAIGTVLHIDCLMSKLARNNDYYTILKRAVILEPNQTVEDIFEGDLWQQCHDIYFDEKLNKDERKEKAHQFYLDHIENMKFKTLWDEKWDCFNDLAIKYWENRKAFMSELMNDASSIGEKWFKSFRTMSSDEIEEHLFKKTLLCIDPAVSTGNKNDFTAAGVISEAGNGFTYIRDLFMKKLTFNQYCDKAIKMLEEYDDITHIVIEKNTYMGSDVVKIKELISQNDKLKHKNYIFINNMQKTNKDEKISTIVDDVNNGAILFVSDKEDSKKAIEQAKEFQGQLYTPHDDFIDMVAEGCKSLKEIKVIGKVTLFDRKKLGL